MSHQESSAVLQQQQFIIMLAAIESTYFRTEHKRKGAIIILPFKLKKGYLQLQVFAHTSHVLHKRCASVPSTLITRDPIDSYALFFFLALAFFSFIAFFLILGISLRTKCPRYAAWMMVAASSSCSAGLSSDPKNSTGGSGSFALFFTIFFFFPLRGRALPTAASSCCSSKLTLGFLAGSPPVYVIEKERFIKP